MSKRGGRKSVHGDGVDRVTGLTLIFRCGMFDALFFLVKKYGGGHDVSILPDLFGGGEHDGVLKNN